MVSFDVLTCKVRCQGRMEHWMITSRPSWALSPLIPWFWSLSSKAERDFWCSLSFWVCQLLYCYCLNEHYCFWIRWEYQFSRLRFIPSLPKHMLPFVSTLKVPPSWAVLLKQLENMLGRQTVSQSGAKRHTFARKVAGKADSRCSISPLVSNCILRATNSWE